MMNCRTAITVTLLLGAIVSDGRAAGKSAALGLLEQQYQERHARFAAEMEQLVADSASPPEVEDAIRRLIPPLGEQTSDIDSLPEHVRPELPLTLSDSERQWRGQLHRIRSDYARDLYHLSRRALGVDEVSLAFHLMREVAFHDSDHPAARKLLGYVRHGDQWVTPFEQSMVRSRFVRHDRFGWLPQTHVARYEQGERYYQGRWMSAADEAAKRHDFKNAWEIESEHFLIKTNYSLERGVELSVALEDFHHFFRREFSAVFNTPQQMRQLFATGRGRKHRHEVHYYRSRDEFVFRLRAKQPGIEVSNGLYLPDDRTAYFFYTPDLESNIETLYHEVTHQLLGESQRRIIKVGEKANFWLIEGIACYLESFETDEQFAVPTGDPRHVRMHWARKRRLEENFYIPLSRFTQMGIDGFRPTNGNAVLQKLYSQSVGLTHFFMHYEQGRYREALIEHLAQLYSPNARVRSNPQPLDELTGVPFASLDQQYLSYLTEMQAALEAEDSHAE